MDKETIFNQYAVEQGYSDWEDILFHFSEFEMPITEFKTHENAVIQLIQEELKKKIIKGKSDIAVLNIKDITNTENIK